MAAYGSGAVQRSSRDGACVMNIDVGGGTSKIAICRDGKVVDLTAIDVGARLVVTDASGVIVRLEEAGRQFGAELGWKLAVGARFTSEQGQMLAARMAERLFEAARGGSPKVGASSLLRLDPLGAAAKVDEITISGGVSEFVYGKEEGNFGDLGPQLAAEIRKRVQAWGPKLERPNEGIRATVIGASQYTTQVSGSTIHVWPMEILPLRNVPVIAPDLEFADEIDPRGVATSVKRVLKRLDLASGERPVAVFAPWRGSATFARLDSFCRGIVDGLSDVLAHGHPVILVG